MSGRKHRPSVSDRARRRAIRAHAARLGVPYSVAARLLAARADPGSPVDADEHRRWLFALREQRSFDLRVRDTRLAADLPLGRAAHLVERFPALRRPVAGSPPAGSPPAGALFDGEAREATLGMLYAVVAHESPVTLPGAEELSWVAELGEEAAVDIVCAGPDRAARLLLDGDRWRLCTRIEAALEAGEAGYNRRVRDAAITLGREFRTTILRRSVEGARHTLDAVLVTAHDGHPPGTRVRLLTGGTGTVVGARWTETGQPVAYEVRVDGGRDVLIVGPDDIEALDRPARPEPALP